MVKHSKKAFQVAVKDDGVAWQRVKTRDEITTRLSFLFLFDIQSDDAACHLLVVISSDKTPAFRNFTTMFANLFKLATRSR